jgi:hypothetical protein
MRTILRAAGRKPRVFLWVVKTVLLGVALAAVVLWPVSRGRSMWVRAERRTMGPGWGEYRSYTAECCDGRVVLGRYWRHGSSALWLAGIRDKVQSCGDGWRWERGLERTS